MPVLLKLADKYSAERLENACREALVHLVNPRYKNIRLILETGQDRPKPSASSPLRRGRQEIKQEPSSVLPISEVAGMNNDTILKKKMRFRRSCRTIVNSWSIRVV